LGSPGGQVGGGIEAEVAVVFFVVLVCAFADPVEAAPSTSRSDITAEVAMVFFIFG